jgi:riboflavin kinase/FMN adenylyltransferase
LGPAAPVPISSLVVRVITDLSQSPFSDADAADHPNRSVVTIGAYDGVHLGHQAIIAQVRRGAQQLGAQSVVITFDRHPAEVVRPESAPKLLTDLEQ